MRIRRPGANACAYVFSSSYGRAVSRLLSKLFRPGSDGGAGMKFVLFYHSLVSDWNHGNAHFLRGVATELLKRGHEVVVYEPRNGWSFSQLVAQNGSEPVREFHNYFPLLHSVTYDPAKLDLDC